MDKKQPELKKADLNIAKRFKEKLLNLGIPVDDVIVFGSKVKGESNKWSDLDICIISPIFGIDSHSERVLLMNIKRGIDDNIEPHPMNLEDFNSKFNPLANEIRKTGISI